LGRLVGWEKAARLHQLMTRIGGPARPPEM
jgi:hypothetical protein